MLKTTAKSHQSSHLLPQRSRKFLPRHPEKQTVKVLFIQFHLFISRYNPQTASIVNAMSKIAA